MSEENERARQQAICQLDSIKEMVAALECDYERLEELKDEKEELQEDLSGADELDRSAAEKALADWIEENQEELDELIKAAGDCPSQEDARERIMEDPLSVQVRSGWYTPGDQGEAEEFEILLCTGGPAVRIRGELGNFNEPERCWLEYQDWGTPWTELVFDSGEMDTVLTYCRCFYFGE